VTEESTGKNQEQEETLVEAAELERVLHYFAADGNYGSAYGLSIMETTHWNQDDWDIIEQVADGDRPVVARLLTESYEKDADQEFIKKQLVETYGVDLSPFGG
jgi:hypothetical protein